MGAEDKTILYEEMNQLFTAGILAVLPSAEAG